MNLLLQNISHENMTEFYVEISWISREGPAGLFVSNRYICLVQSDVFYSAYVYEFDCWQYTVYRANTVTWYPVKENIPDAALQVYMHLIFSI